MGSCNSGGKGESSVAGNIGNKQGAMQSEKAFKSLTKKDANDWLDTHNAGDYMELAPDSIKIGDVPFSWLSGFKSVDSKGMTQFHNVYQATIQMNNGEYPIFETVVDTVRKGKTTQYKFNKSSMGGSGLR